MDEQTDDAKALKAMQEGLQRATREREDAAWAEAVADPDALCAAVCRVLPEHERINCTPKALEMFEAFRAMKANPDSRYAPFWGRDRTAGRIIAAINAARNGDVALRPPLQIDGGLSGQQLRDRKRELTKVRKALTLAMNDPVFAFLQQDRTRGHAFSEAQYRATWGMPQSGEQREQPHGDHDTEVAEAALANGSNTIWHLLNYLDHVEQFEAEFRPVRESGFTEARAFFHKAFESMAYVAHRRPAAGMTQADLLDGDPNLSFALYSFCRDFYSIAEAEAFEADGKPRKQKLIRDELARKSFLGRSWVAEIQKDFPKG